MLFRIDPASPRPLGDQIAASVRRALAEGTVRPGEKLPPARELAASLAVNVHTVLRGYQQLRDEGLIELRRGRGAVVTASLDPERLRLSERVADLVAQARALGMRDDELLTLLRTALG
ncbi:GntR family transcriptional regulator [Yinghuangia sp. ASG 101]|uniref:GntR family transcriptional regulator n=1 Tax=Yinghuangia sp. ASG 101 TaxID=2896848 RepID=UPI001E2E24A8|nr:GntR family transcriptional regulator [Yinghuangia sp. ASG 101]UGQ11679.1 GntR family transcriptional regulator [Yinghuangia sp. ASG 101]